MDIFTEKKVCEILRQKQPYHEIIKDRYPFIIKMRTPPVYMSMDQFTVRIAREEVDRFGKPKPQRRRYDQLIVAKPHFKAYGGDILTFAVEIKISIADFKADKKYSEGLAHPDYFFSQPLKLKVWVHTFLMHCSLAFTKSWD